MKKIAYVILMFFLLVIIRCASPSGGLKFIEEPKGGDIVIFGNVIIENINQEFAFDNWDFGAQVVIVGRTRGDTISHYTVNTDVLGYYFLPNVPPGQYALKAVILPIPGGVPLKLVNDLSSSSSEFYRMRHPEQPIEYTANWLPPNKMDGRILNLGIVWLGMRTAEVSDLSTKSIGVIIASKFSESLKTKRFFESGYPYTREDPLTYFKKKFPNSGWWKF